MASTFYANGIEALVDGTVDWGTSTIKAMLTTEGYDPETIDPDLNDFYNDVSTYQANGTTDPTLTVTVNKDAANNEVELDDSNATTTWTAVTGAELLEGCVIYYSTGTATTSNLIMWNLFSSAVTSNGSNIEVTWDTEGHGKFSY